MYGLEIIPSKADYNSTNGIFGNSNGNSNDDLRYLRSTNTLALNIEEFYESYNALSKSNKIPSFSSDEYYDYSNKVYNVDETDSKKHDNCDCLKKNPLSESGDKCFKGLKQDSYNGIKTKKVKRSIEFETVESSNRKSWTESSSLSTLENFNLNLISVQIPSTGGLFKNALTTSNVSCRTMLLGDSGILSCNSSGIINLDQLVSLCELDYASAPSTDWVYGYLESSKSKCKSVLEFDINFYITLINGTKVVNETKLQELCPNNCTNNGVCSISGICNCNPDYSSYDCSIKKSDLPILFNSTYTNNIFDLSKQSLTDIFLIVSKFLIDTETATLKCTILIKNNNAVPITILSSNSSLTISSVNYNLIHVNLSSITKSANEAGYLFLNFSISNDNVNFTLPLRMTAYNSLLYDCDSSSQSCRNLGSNEESRNTQTILIIVFVILGFVLIVGLIVAAVSYWKYKKNISKRTVVPAKEDPQVLDASPIYFEAQTIEITEETFPEQTETENETLEQNEIEIPIERIIPIETSETDALYKY
jgi:hypothetical protein